MLNELASLAFKNTLGILDNLIPQIKNYISDKISKEVHSVL
jgi:hypothetical protein